MNKNISDTIEAIQKSLKDNSFVKLTLGNYKGKEADLKGIQTRKILIRKEPHLSFTYRYKTKDIVKNYAFDDVADILQDIITEDNFRHVRLHTLNFDLLLEFDHKGTWSLRRTKSSMNELPSLEHDKQKQRKIASTGKQYLHELKITDKEGKVYKATQNKYRQINHYIEILSSLLEKLPARDLTKVVDMGSGKGYLTFALYDYLNNELNRTAHVVGVDYRKDLVDLCNQVAKNSGFRHLEFVQGEIDQYEDKDINVLIALHACDTATDDAICKGISNQADLIVVAPCCHKQIRREIEKHKTNNDLDFLLRHGIFLERQAEMVTDGIRALILEYFGYTTKVFEFISDAHTPKNVLVVGLKNANAKIDKEGILEKIKTTKSYFGIEYHHLERLMKLESL